MSSTTVTAGEPRTSSLVPMMIIGLLFFVMGFFTWLNGPLISFVKVAFTLDDINAFLVPFAFYVSYFVLALPAGAVLKRTGMKKGMVLGLFIMAIGAALFGEFVRIRILIQTRKDAITIPPVAVQHGPNETGTFESDVVVKEAGESSDTDYYVLRAPTG